MTYTGIGRRSRLRALVKTFSDIWTEADKELVSPVARNGNSDTFCKQTGETVRHNNKLLSPITKNNYIKISNIHK